MPELKKARSPIVVTVFGKVTVSRLAVFWNVPGWTEVIAVWLKSKLVIPESSNDEPLSVVTVFGISMFFKLVQPWKALPLIVVNPLGSLTLLKLEQPWNRPSGKLVTWVADKSMVVREVVTVLVVVEPLVVDTFPNTLVPNSFKLFGTFTSVKLLQFWKALLPIFSNFVAWLKSRLVIPLFKNALSDTVCSTVLLLKLMVFKPLVSLKASWPT